MPRDWVDLASIPTKCLKNRVHRKVVWKVKRKLVGNSGKFVAKFLLQNVCHINLGLVLTCQMLGTNLQYLHLHRRGCSFCHPVIRVTRLAFLMNMFTILLTKTTQIWKYVMIRYSTKRTKWQISSHLLVYQKNWQSNFIIWSYLSPEYSFYIVCM